MDIHSKIYLAGHRGLVGSAILRELEKQGFDHILTASSSELDLREQMAVRNFFAQEKPDYVFLAAAKVGGIYANSTYPANFILDNLQIETNVIDAAYQNKVKKLLFLGSSCIYPKECPQPIKEDYLLTSPLESTNEWYALAKIAGIKLCAAFRKQYNFNAISAMPTNLYGINDNFNLENSHVIPALIKKIHNAKVNNTPNVEVWGTGKAFREFLYVDDLAEALVFLMQNYNEEQHINIGTGHDQSIADLAQLISKIIGYQGQIIYNNNMPDGTIKKLLDVNKINNLGWNAKTSLQDGLTKTYNWYKSTL